MLLLSILALLSLSASSVAGHENAPSSYAPESTAGKLVSYVVSDYFHNPTSIAFDSADGSFYVANANSNNITVLNASSNTVTGIISLFHYPYSVSYDSYNNYLLVTNESFPLSFNTNTSVYSISSGSIVHIFNSSNKYVINNRSGNFYVARGSVISVISGTSWSYLSNITIANNVDSLYFDSQLNLLLAGTSNNTVEMINGSTGRIAGTVSGPHFDKGSGDISEITSDASGKVVYMVTGSYPEHVESINIENGHLYWSRSNTGIGDLVYDPANDLIFGISGYGYVDALISYSGNIFTTFSVDGGPFSTSTSISYNPLSKEIYVATSFPSGFTNYIAIINETYTPSEQRSMFTGFSILSVCAAIAATSLLILAFRRRGML